MHWRLEDASAEGTLAVSAAAAAVEEVLVTDAAAAAAEMAAGAENMAVAAWEFVLPVLPVPTAESLRVAGSAVVPFVEVAVAV